MLNHDVTLDSGAQHSLAYCNLPVTELYSKHREVFVQFVERPRLQNGTLWLKTGSCFASSKS